MNIFKRTEHAFGRAYIDRVCESEYQGQHFKRINERPIEYRFVFQAILQFRPKSVLDIGTGTTALPHLIRNCGCLVTATDNRTDYWPKGMYNRHFSVLDDDITNTRVTGTYDLVTCVSVIEHIVKVDVAVRNMLSLTTPGGYLLLTFPYSENAHCENVYAREESSYPKDLPYKCSVYSREFLDRWCAENGVAVAAQEFWRVWSGRLWTFGEWLSAPEQVDASDEHHLTCVLLKKIGK